MQKLFLKETVQIERNLIIRKTTFFCSILRDILKLNLQNFNGSIQEYSPLYLKMRVDLLHRNLERKFGTEINFYWVEILNNSCELPIEIKRGCVLGFFVAEPEHLKF